MTSLQKTTAAEQLKELARNPFDLTRGLTPERIERYTSQAAGWKLLYGTERVDDATLEALFSLAKEVDAVTKMQRQQAGVKMNVFEDRPVLHTAVRDLFGEPKNKQATDLAKREVEKLRGFIEATKHTTDLIVVAIGGSELGPEAQYLALKAHLIDGRRVHFINNIDPDTITSQLQEIDLNKALVLVISKSGTTLETATNEAFVRSLFVQKGVDPNANFIAVTMPGTPMDNKDHYKEVFYLWDWVGGRFSASSMGGGVMLAWAFGLDVYMEFLEGCHEMDRVALEQDPKKNLPLLLALLGIWNRNFLNLPTLAIIPYSYALQRYAAHLQQVDMESNGKRVTTNREPVETKTGPIVWGEPGTSAQHSFFQLLHQGTNVVPIEFIGFQHPQWGKDFQYEGTLSHTKLVSNLFAQAIALAEGKQDQDANKAFPGNRPSCQLLAKKLTPRSLGSLFALYEHKVAFQGYIWGINSFDQEGVQLGKVLANRVIDRFSEKKEAYPLGDAFINQLKAL